MKLRFSDARRPLLSRSDLLIAFSVILLGLLLSALISYSNPLLVAGGCLGLLVLSVVIFRVDWGIYILVASVFTFEYSAGGALAVNLTVSDAIVGALAIGTFLIFATSKARFTFKPVFLLLGLYLLALILSTLAAGGSTSLIARLVQFSEFGLAAFIILQLLTTNLPWKPLLVILSVGATVLAAITFYTNVIVAGLARKNINLLNTNSWAFIFDLVVPVVVAYLLLRNRDTSLRWLWLLAPVLILGSLTTLSRGGYLGLAAGLMVVIALSGPSRWIKVVPAGLILLVLILFFVPDQVLTNVSSTTTFDDYRAYQWGAAFNTFFNNPLLGIGPGNLANVPVYSPYGNVAQNDPHNFVARVAGETGLVGLVAVLGIMLISMRRMFINFFQLKPLSHPLSVLNLGMLGGMVAYIVHAFFEVFWVRGSGLLFWIYIGLAYASATIYTHLRKGEE